MERSAYRSMALLLCNLIIVIVTIIIRYDVGRGKQAAAKVFMQIRNTLHHTFQSLHRIGIRTLKAIFQPGTWNAPRIYLCYVLMLNAVLS